MSTIPTEFKKSALSLLESTVNVGEKVFTKEELAIAIDGFTQNLWRLKKDQTKKYIEEHKDSVLIEFYKLVKDEIPLERTNLYYFKNENIGDKDKPVWRANAILTSYGIQWMLQQSPNIKRVHKPELVGPNDTFVTGFKDGQMKVLEHIPSYEDTPESTMKGRNIYKAAYCVVEFTDHSEHFIIPKSKLDASYEREKNYAGDNKRKNWYAYALRLIFFQIPKFVKCLADSEDIALERSFQDEPQDIESEVISSEGSAEKVPFVPPTKESFLKKDGELLEPKAPTPPKKKATDKAVVKPTPQKPAEEKVQEKVEKPAEEVQSQAKEADVEVDKDVPSGDEFL